MTSKTLKVYEAGTNSKYLGNTNIPNPCYEPTVFEKIKQFFGFSIY